MEETMIILRDKDTNLRVGTISEAQLKFLIDQLEEESLNDRDYYINVETLEMFEKNGIDQDLLQLLKLAMGSRQEMELEWSRE
jgi:hypothetical protein